MSYLIVPMNLPILSWGTTLLTRPVSYASLPLMLKPVKSIYVATFLDTFRIKGIPGVEQNIPRLALKKLIISKYCLNYDPNECNIIVYLY